MNRPPLEDLAAIAYAAAREILAVRAAGFDAIKKADGSPVTLADQRAEAAIKAGLVELMPGAPMIGEESVAAGDIPAFGASYFCVDPLDGTRDFVAGGDEFTVNIGWIENGAPVSGVVLAPTSGEVYLGEPGRALRGVYDMQGCAMREVLAPIRPADAKAAAGWRVIASRHSGKNSKTMRFMQALGPSTLVHGSSSIKFCRVAEGAADLYPRFGEVSEWDTAAGHAILAAAGGGTIRFDGAPLTYGHVEDKFRVRGFLAFANTDAQRAARAVLEADESLR